MSPEPESFPRVPLVFGVVGHRAFSKGIVPALKTAVQDIFREFHAAFPQTPFVVLSSLAEGGDQVAVEAALEWANAAEHGHSVEIEIRVPLPFPQDVFAQSTSFSNTPEGKIAAEQMQQWIAEKKVHSFVVPLPTGIMPGDPSTCPVLGSDPNTKKNRHTCYANAGGYIVRHCHVLIALWDGGCTRGSGGTAEFVEFKLNGTPPPLFPDRRPLQLSNETGPVFIVHTARNDESASRPGELIVRVPSWDRNLALIVPKSRRVLEDSLVYSLASRVHNSLGWSHSTMGDTEDTRKLKRMKSEWRQFRDMCRAIDHFNRDIVDHAAELQKETVRALPTMLGNGQSTPDPAPAFERLVKLRAAAAALSRNWLDPQLKEYQVWLFMLIFSGAVFFHLYAHLFVIFPRLPIHADHLPLWLALSLTSLAAAGALVGRAWLLRIDERRLDYRALAEALRVRCWWAVAGLSASTADAYLGQFRGEMSWIRRALLSIAPPPAFWRDHFPKTDQMQRERLLLAQERWVIEQASYFVKSRDEHHHRAINCRRWGLGLASTGWLLALTLLYLLWVHWENPATSWHPGPDMVPGEAARQTKDHHPATDAQHPSHFLLITSGLLVLGGGLLIAYCERESHEELAKHYDRLAVVFNQGQRELKTHLAPESIEAANVEAAQAVIEQLGREALTEHAQWLILRRARPFELLIH